MQFILKNKFRLIFALCAVAIVPIFSGCGSGSSSYMVPLEIWGVNDDSTAYTEIIDQYRKLNPYVGEIKYRKFSQATYKQELLDALASGQGPDIFMINNGWFPSFENKLEPAPAPFVSETDLKNNFPDIVAGDFTSAGKVYAVPLSIDSLAMYYNRDLFNAAGISSVPKTWSEVDENVAKLTSIDSNGNILRSGVALGTAQNVNRATDILGTLMMQAGASLPTKKGETAKFDEGVVNSNGNVAQAGEQALAYYTKFASPVSADNVINPVYSWNPKKYDSVDAFAEGSVAMMFNYHWKYAEIKNKNAKLNFAVAPIPQAYPDKPVTYGSYWGYAVSKNKMVQSSAAASAAGQQVAMATTITNEMRTHEAWQFLRFLTLKNSGTIRLYNAVTKNYKDFPTSFDPALEYLKRTQQPAARRDIIDSQKADALLGVFASGNLIAKHWYQYDPEAVNNIFKDMIDSVNKGEMTYHEALLKARNKVNYASGINIE